MTAVSLIGSRQTPALILAEIEKVGVWVRQHSHVARSGHAEGADYAAEKGALKNCEVFLPWAGFNKELPILGTSIVVAADPVLDELVRRFHPAPDRLTRGAFALMRRNGCQVLGKDANDPVDAVVCWTPPDKGGTTQALRIAVAHKIPVLNMIDARFSTAAAVIKELEKLGK